MLSPWGGIPRAGSYFAPKEPPSASPLPRAAPFLFQRAPSGKKGALSPALASASLDSSFAFPSTDLWPKPLKYSRRYAQELSGQRLSRRGLWSRSPKSTSEPVESQEPKRTERCAAAGTDLPALEMGKAAATTTEWEQD
ncbi:hypothetical protein P7K49_006983 [Saguinus oedipus]|uniref:Uncharacterized protein n=1 Tax=Saguinus oedipus TaxID=9490 RepID=A0ABQ9W3Z3_SAGOE|nr:hypothetical protein P7K49_006983 [Saguinus oedipus]